MLAKDISSEYRSFWRLNCEEQIADHLFPIFEFLDITNSDYQEIKNNLIDQIQDKQEN
ncbi:MAG: hypothetical protein JXR16_10610 [Bermanella sp.]